MFSSSDFLFYFSIHNHYFIIVSIHYDEIITFASLRFGSFRNYKGMRPRSITYWHKIAVRGCPQHITPLKYT